MELRGEDLPSLEWDNTGIQEYPEVWQDDTDTSVARGLDDEMALELDLELELGSRDSRDSTSLRSLEEARPSEREPSAESSTSTVQDGSSASRQGSLTLALSREQSPAADPLTESGYEGMDSSSLLLRTPLSPVAEFPAESGALSSDSAVSGSADRLNGNSCERRANRDSAYWDDGLDTLAARAALESVGEAMDLLQYAQQEWRGTTPRAVTIRQGYEEMATKYHLTHIQRVRGDNYCAVRAALYQLLSKGLPPPNANRCRRLLETAGSWVTAWSFGSRLPYDISTARSGMQDCLNALSSLGEELKGAEGAGRHLRQQWNSDPDLDLRCMEAVKLHMLAAAVQLERDQSALQTVPLFATLLFARDTSATPRDLMANHLNLVGDSGGLEQIEMFLLGHTLGVTLRVIRPGAHAQSDFVTFYPDGESAAGGRPLLTLVAEDDRHYNVAS
ncbi:ubiquitin thioesterase otulin-like isoform X2 [Pollicipes pollicipes]|uniref:ubiquitin thioesterase otulin-like isoform X2 n=1 Tax=Pollicipes pollicipes TaxID=41117 RepID=UPI001885178F|nr:ubiquitin thioesterase otulin-like isoform X2 [Pollicipes pollicipes]